jgi:hypothetical protein
LQRSGIRYPHSLHIQDLQITFGKPRFDLWARTMHQYQPNAQAGQQVEVMNKLDKFAIRYYFATESDDEYFVTKGIDIRRYGTKPGKKINVGYHDLRILGIIDGRFITQRAVRLKYQENKRCRNP